MATRHKNRVHREWTHSNPPADRRNGLFCTLYDELGQKLEGTAKDAFIQNETGGPLGCRRRAAEAAGLPFLRR